VLQASLTDVAGVPTIGLGNDPAKIAVHVFDPKWQTGAPIVQHRFFRDQ
jgi:hypothetical protein